MGKKSEWSPSFCANELLKQLDRRGVTPRHVADAIVEKGGATLDAVAHAFINPALSESATNETFDVCTKDLIARLRERCRSQKELWRRVPYLALEADGRTGYSDNYAKTYQLGYWPVAENRGVYTVYVDLATGDLVNPDNPRRRASDDSVFLLLRDPQKLDAGAVLANLERRAQEPHWKGYDEKEQIQWRNKTRRKLRLRHLYTREQHHSAFFSTV